MSTRTHAKYEILAAISEPKQMRVLLAVAVPLARARDGHVTPLYVSSERSVPHWFAVPEDLEDVVGEPRTISGRTVGQAALDYVHEFKPDLLLLYWRGKPSRGRYLLGRTLDPLIQYAACDVAVVRVKQEAEAFAKTMANLKRITVPVGGGPNAQLALDIALDLGTEVQVTALRVAQSSMGRAATQAQNEILTSALKQVRDADRIQARVELAPSVTQGIQQATKEDCDLMLIGATRDSTVDRLLFGNLPQQIVQQVSIPTIIIRRHDASPAGIWRRTVWRVVNLLPQLTTEERSGIYRQVRGSARGDADFYLMVLLATGIAALGLLLNSPAVIIGAMLMAPLMAALIGASLAIVQGDAWLLRVSLRTVLLGSLVVLIVSAAIGLAVPGNRVTTEMLGRTTPSLLDLTVALISGAAAAYAHSRKDVASALPGTAIAVALLPPLATVGIALTELRPDLAIGAFLMFLVNLAAIVSAASLVFLWIGFHPEAGEEKRARVFRGGVLGTVIMLVAITALLTVLGIRSIRSTQRHQQAERAISQHFEALMPTANLAEWQISESAGVTHIRIRVTSSELPPQEEAEHLQQVLAEAMERPVSLEILLSPALQLSPVAPGNVSAASGQ